MAKQVNINLDDDTAQVLDRMATEEGLDNRSAFIRKLIRQEVVRRYRVVGIEALPHPEGAEIVPVVKIERADQ